MFHYPSELIRMNLCWRNLEASGTLLNVQTIDSNKVFDVKIQTNFILARINVTFVNCAILTEYIWYQWGHIGVFVKWFQFDDNKSSFEFGNNAIIKYQWNCQARFICRQKVTQLFWRLFQTPDETPVRNQQMTFSMKEKRIFHLIAAKLSKSSWKCQISTWILW